MTRMPMTEIDVSNFTYVAESNTLVTEVSSYNPRLEYIYDDACDRGIAIRGKRDVVTFYYDTREDSHDGDVICWKFSPISEDIRKNPTLENMTLVVFND